MRLFKVMFTLLFLACTTQMVNAQGKSPFAQKKGTSNKTEQMAKDLGLNGSQKQQVETINVELQNKLVVIRKELMSSTSKNETRPSQAAKNQAKTKRQAARKDYRTKLKGILTPEQFAKWKEMRQEEKANKNKN